MKNLISGCSHIQVKDWPGYREAVESALTQRFQELGIVGVVVASKSNRRLVAKVDALPATSAEEAEKMLM